MPRHTRPPKPHKQRYKQKPIPRPYKRKQAKKPSVAIRYPLPLEEEVYEYEKQ